MKQSGRNVEIGGGLEAVGKRNETTIDSSSGTKSYSGDKAASKRKNEKQARRNARRLEKKKAAEAQGQGK